ncbi:hypothetical protein ACOMHN_052546 [Nucella lapillus]
MSQIHMATSTVMRPRHRWQQDVLSAAKPPHIYGVMWALWFLLISCVTPAVGFNVDTVKPIIYKGPPGSYFGYSVAMLENRKGGW